MRIFISYRRDDTAGYVGRLHDSLSKYFGTQNVFMDVSTIPLGTDFDAKTHQYIQQSDVFIPVIGRVYSTISNESGRRLFNENDLVRNEVAAALRLGKRVIPLLVEGALMPAPSDLPDVMQDLTRQNALHIGNHDWQHDIDVLIRAIDPTGLAYANKVKKPNQWLNVVVILIILAMTAFGMYYFVSQGLFRSFNTPSSNGNAGNVSSFQPQSQPQSTRIELSNCTITVKEGFGAFIYAEPDFSSSRLGSASTGELLNSTVKDKQPLISYYYVTAGGVTGWIKDNPINYQVSPGCV